MQLVKSETKKSSILPLLAVGTFGLHLFTLLLLLFNGSMLQDLKRQLTPQSLVQLVDGRAITVDPKPSYDRHSETIRHFVGETMTLMLTWSRQQPPLTVWEISSQLLSPELKPKFQSEITNLNANNQFANTNQENEYVLVIEKISQPTPIANGKWAVEILANQLNFSGYNNLGTSIPFNKQILVRAIDKSKTFLPTKPLPWHLAAYRLGEARLEIYDICDLKDNKCFTKSN
ncbi:hypothetical protein H6G54_04830 [Anabaena cylindrica FACHB-243]|uniref:Uncharacterized protein n=1 Tax=Anabaena cylindrica (strain ATCC 27899 / PCC 7122) TaxID=272123 RepID=K9ZPB0_ANACC|nr:MULTISPECIES: hypothetical protein [Anabaena]AFZ60629.1 hypothetical protein Anacy_5303 [Anabaena cylindrica PCC 7122]MBD2417048.1 hypothetical protein [Anabaena cylindrica FACHB-243]MBY5280377.1 hypothetical protein [Anabaena sp. CCAP 1446/1C]MBY5307612.1 hypothetical protein [Anabaena sp. CCAP 1446/1C]MCM2407183.1 hypothetical protein [Anabaena sp. CCAP 1446/1C]